MPHLKGAAAIYSERNLQGNLVPYTTNPTSAAGVLNILPPGPERVLWHVTNLSANDMYLGFDQQVGSSNGILLSGNGGFISMHVTEDFELVTLPVYLYSSVAGNQVYVVHMRRENKVQEG